MKILSCFSRLTGFLALVVVPVVARAQGGPPPKPPVEAVRTTGPIAVDGRLDEPVWAGGHPVTDFSQKDPVEGGAPSQRTEVRVAYDDEAIYVGARLYDAAPESILVRLSRRDVSIPADRFSIYLDPYHDKRTGYYFLVNVAGTLFDGTLSNDGSEDNSWDGVWQARTQVDKLGWTCEMRIPYSQLRFQKADRYVWGVNFRRVIPRNNEEDFLVYQPKKESGFVSRWPDLVGIENVHPGRAIEVLPYVTSKGEYLQHDAADPFHNGHDVKPAAGGDLRMSVGSKLTLNTTVNPDFGQVEVDPAVVNLSDVESYFQEKRPFFVDGAAIFHFGNEGADNYWGFNWPDPAFFYSRRIGRSPQGQAPNADFADVPVGTSILGAAKLTGKLAPSWNFGTLQAITASEMARLQTAGARSDAEIEPLTYYGVARTQKEFKDRRQGLGFMTTLAERSFDGDGLRDQVNSSSLMNGMDGWWFLDRDNVWVISGWSAMSYVRGNSARITSLQQSSRHYFQRPDAHHVHLDPFATSLTGWGSRYWLNKQKGNVIFNAALGGLSPEFDVNDVGFQSRSDLVNGHIGGGYKWTETTRTHKYLDVLGSVFQSYNYDGDRIASGLWSAADVSFPNNWSVNPRLAYNPQTVNDRRTRGGPLSLNPSGYEVGTYAETNSKGKLYYYVDTDGYFQQQGSTEWYVNPGVEWKPVSNLLVSFGPNFGRNVSNAQYVDQYADPAATATFGRRYVMARLEQTTLSANIRLNWSFTPNLSVQTFLQPLISSGDYSDFKALARPRSYDFDPIAYAGPDPDFNFKSLRGNTVLRWEYRPGSTLFFVWTQQRNDFENTGEFRFGPSFHRLTRAGADNIFLAKASYYFDL